jgi:hypothetical protein
MRIPSAREIPVGKISYNFTPLNSSKATFSRFKIPLSAKRLNISNDNLVPPLDLKDPTH